ncbi:unnamed protein product [Rangifer tarandus platyrhynchus]|uniref:Uncharacterized protein n=1 Tax=Rangifer tarandus platyrhynchus TaxID=3082113 RepID=A0ABN8Z7C2_RANTA|nr:unnamed protein product [Rangifer tarandus platyrhynchus]CAI9688154.1 unnamed protein product [Rangifer tarandus platyrhynchus]
MTRGACRAPPPLGRWTAAAPGLGLGGGRGANLGWPAAAAALNGGGGLRRARGRAYACLDRLLGLRALRGRRPAAAGAPGQQTAPPPRPLTQGLTLNVLRGLPDSAPLPIGSLARRAPGPVGRVRQSDGSARPVGVSQALEWPSVLGARHEAESLWQRGRVAKGQ